MKTNPKFKAFMQRLRQQANLSQIQLAEMVGISVISYKRYECGDRVPDARTAISIAKALNTTVEKLWKY